MNILLAQSADDDKSPTWISNFEWTFSLLISSWTFGVVSGVFPLLTYLVSSSIVLKCLSAEIEFFLNVKLLEWVKFRENDLMDPTSHFEYYLFL
jgi:ABC-type amino acid transport system permease subunit